jgi:uncharacterized protein YcbK (DUF882 family)
MNINRRQFISTTVQTALCCLFPGSLLAANALAARGDVRALSLYNLHTNERLSIGYFKDGRYETQALRKIDFIMRDHRSGEIKTIQRPLLDLLFELSGQMDASCCFHIISGYRSPTTNAQLRNRSKGVAGGSLHMQGRAIDIRVPGCTTSRLRQVCQDLKAGGVGYYPGSDFVHVDTGRVRYWRG